LYDAAIVAASPGAATTRAVDALQIARDARVWIFAFGKAATPMAAAAVASLLRSLHSIVGGVIVNSDGAASPYPTVVGLRGDHPVPGTHSFAAAAKIAEVSAGRRGNDVAIVLMSGGASSLIGAPLRGMNESDITLLYEILLGSGLDIAATNAVRKRFSRWGGGRLALALAPAATHCLAISDVAGDDLAVIGSGPCVPDPTSSADVLEILKRSGLAERVPQAYRDYLTSVGRGAIPETPKKSHPAFAHVTARVIGNNRMALDGVAAEARAKGLEVDLIEERLSGDAGTTGEAIARHLISLRAARASRRCVIWGGETTVNLGAGPQAGRSSGGGRCQELALAAARVLGSAAGEADGITLLAAGTDGRDGATDAAGAMVDARTWETITAAGRDPMHALASHESNAALRLANALIPRRETGTNVNDVVIGLV
jgi:hydroxypyruvate reductase